MIVKFCVWRSHRLSPVWLPGLWAFHNRRIISNISPLIWSTGSCVIPPAPHQQVRKYRNTHTHTEWSSSVRFGLSPHVSCVFSISDEPLPTIVSVSVTTGGQDGNKKCTENTVTLNTTESVNTVRNFCTGKTVLGDVIWFRNLSCLCVPQILRLKLIQGMKMRKKCYIIYTICSWKIRQQLNQCRI